MPSPGPTPTPSSIAPSPMPSLLELHLNQFVSTPLQPSPFQSPSVGSISIPGAKRRRTHHTTVIPSFEWTSAHQACFESHIARLTASCSFPFAWVKNIKWLDFLDSFLPAATLILHHVLANWLILAEIEKYPAAAKENAQGLEGTLQCDSWTGVNFIISSHSC